jgi:hypothetical protein
LFYILQKRPRPQAPSAAFVVDGAPSMSYTSQVYPQPSDDGTTTYAPGTPVTSMKLYDPSDPTTYPGYHSVPTSSPDGDVHVPVVSYDGGLHGNTLANMQTGSLGGNTPPPNMQNGGLGGNTLANMQTARPQGYHGLPTV